MTDHYTTLGITPEATDAEVKQGYRRASAKAHPDRNGGDTEAQQRVNAAYEVLSDPDRRADYDAAGAGDPARERLIKLFDSYIEHATGVDDAVPRFERLVRDSIVQLHKLKQSATSHVSRIERLVNKVQGPPLWESLCRKHIAKHTKDGIDADAEIATNERMLVLLAAYKDAPRGTDAATLREWAMLPWMTDTRG